MIINETTLWIKRCRLCFPHLVQPQARDRGDPAYNANFVMEPNAEEYAEAMKIAGAIAAGKWGEQAQGVLNLIATDKRLRCWGDGNTKLDRKGEVYDGFKDMVYISASTTKKPDLRGADAQPLPPTAPMNTMFTGGNWVAAVVSFWPQDNEHGRAIRAQLDGVQFLEEGEHFGAVGPDVGAIFTPSANAPAPTAPAPGAPVMPTVDPFS